jgi:hypothetical protein
MSLAGGSILVDPRLEGLFDLFSCRKRHWVFAGLKLKAFKADFNKCCNSLASLNGVDLKSL